MSNETEYLAPISVLRLFETTKVERQSFALQVIERIQEGTADPLETLLQARCMEDTLNQLTDNRIFRELVLEAAQKEGKSFEFHNAKFDTREVGVKYNFEKCGDVEWEMLDAEIKGLTERKKTRETLLKTIPVSGMVITDESTGETSKIYPPSKLSTTSVCVTLK